MSKHKQKQTKTSAISGNVALITGGAKRIGACMATTLHHAGLNIVIHYQHSAKAASQLQAQLNQQRSASCVIIQADLSAQSNIETLIKQSVESMGRLDVLINNASAFFPTPLSDANEKDWNALFDINLKAPFFLAKAATAHLKKQQGSIINMIDIYAERPLKDHPIYSASKSGLASITQSLALSLAPDIRVNAIAPGAILWPENQTDEVAQKKLLSRTPLNRLGDPQDIANTALFLIKDAPFITGQIIRVDGGRSVVA